MSFLRSIFEVNSFGEVENIADGKLPYEWSGSGKLFLTIPFKRKILKTEDCCAYTSSPIPVM
jgi:hypothetical protein